MKAQRICSVLLAVAIAVPLGTVVASATEPSILPRARPASAPAATSIVKRSSVAPKGHTTRIVRSHPRSTRVAWRLNRHHQCDGWFGCGFTVPLYLGIAF